MTEVRVKIVSEGRRSYLFLHLSVREEVQLLSKDLLLIQHLLVIDLLHQSRVVDAVRLQKLHVGDLERLADRLRD